MRAEGRSPATWRACATNATLLALVLSLASGFGSGCKRPKASASADAGARGGDARLGDGGEGGNGGHGGGEGGGPLEPVEENAVPAGPPEGATPATFERKPVVLGQRTVESFAVRLLVELGGVTPGDPPVKNRLEVVTSERRVEETLAVTDGNRSKVRTSYEEKASTVNIDGNEKTTVSALRGKTYVVRQKDAGVAVSAARGGAVSTAETAELEQAYRELGKPDPIAAAIPEGEVAPGASMPDLAQALETEISRSAEGFRVSRGAATFQGGSAGVGRFAVRFLLSKDDGPMRFEMNVQGTLRVQAATSMPTSLELMGPVRVTPVPEAAGSPRLSVTGTGHVEMTFHASPIKAP